MRLSDAIQSFPSLFLAVLFLYIVEPRIENIVILLVVGRLPMFIRVARAETVTVVNSLFVDAARCLGASGWWLCLYEIAPAILPTMLTLAALEIGVLMLVESALSFLGVGIQAPGVSWGIMVSEGRDWIQSAWWLTVFPGLCIATVSISCNVLSNWLRLATNPSNDGVWIRTFTHRTLACRPCCRNLGSNVAAAFDRRLIRGVPYCAWYGACSSPDKLDRGSSRNLAIIGESGSGKSVLARTILGTLVSPPGHVTAGRIRLNGIDLLALDARSYRKLQGDRVAMVFQDALVAFNPLYQIGWQIAEVFNIHRYMPMKAGFERAIGLLRRVGIPNPEQRAHAYPHQLSGGMRQRAMIALAVALEPDVLLADEPTTALDVTVQAQIMALLESLRKKPGWL